MDGDELLNLCPDRVQGWEEFLRKFDPLVITTIRRTLRRYPPCNIDLWTDVRKLVYLTLIAHNARLLREFVPIHAGAAIGFINVMTANVVHDNMTQKIRHASESLPESLPASKQKDNSRLIREIDDLLRCHVRAMERQIFWLHYRHGMTAKEIATIPAFGLAFKGVERVLTAVRHVHPVSGEQEASIERESRRVMGSECPREARLRLVAVGLAEPTEAQDLLDHAANCDWCGSRLREAVQDLGTPPTQEEMQFASSCHFADPRRRRAFAKQLARAPKQGFWTNWLRKITGSG